LRLPGKIPGLRSKPVNRIFFLLFFVLPRIKPGFYSIGGKSDFQHSSYEICPIPILYSLP